MRLIIIFCAFFLCTYLPSIGQAVGIGTPTPDASAMLEVVSSNRGLLIPRMASRTSISGPVEGLLVYETGTKLLYQYDGSTWRKLLNSTFWNSSDTRALVFNTTDSVGIGTSLPTERLQVSGNIRTTGALKVSGDAGIGVTTPEQRLHVRSATSSEGILLEAVDPILQLRQSNTPLTGYTDKGFIQLNGDDLRMGTNSANNSGKFVVRTNGNDRMWVDSAGNVTVGPAYKVANGYRFSVNGKIMAEEVRVQLDADWPDYVFTPGYQLRPLADLQAFIDQKKHLPGIMPASEVKANGLELGDTQKRMMEKIEELTLYILQLNREIEILKQKPCN